MTQKTVNPVDDIAIVGVIDPDAYSANTYTTGWISMASFSAIMAIVLAGDMASNSTVDAKIEQATDGSGTGAKDVDDSDITQLTQAGTDDSNKQVAIGVHAESLDVNNNFTHVRLSVTVATAASDAAGVVLGLRARYGPESGRDLASVAELVRL